MRKLSDIKRERQTRSQRATERAEYRAAGSEIPQTHWTSGMMLDYFIEERKKCKVRIQDMNDQRSRITAMGAIKQLGFDGSQFVSLVDWVRDTDGLTTIFFTIRKAKQFKKDHKHLFTEDDSDE